MSDFPLSQVATWSKLLYFFWIMDQKLEPLMLNLSIHSLTNQRWRWRNANAFFLSLLKMDNTRVKLCLLNQKGFFSLALSH